MVVYKCNVFAIATSNRHMWLGRTVNAKTRPATIPDLVNEIKMHENKITALEKITQHKSDYVRLIGGNGWSHGAVELHHDGKVGMLCDDVFDSSEKGPTVVCRMLGFNHGVYQRGANYTIPANATTILDEVYCYGSESNIDDCSHHSWGDHNCGLHERAGVRCD